MFVDLETPCLCAKEIRQIQWEPNFPAFTSSPDSATILGCYPRFSLNSFVRWRAPFLWKGCPTVF